MDEWGTAGPRERSRAELIGLRETCQAKLDEIGLDLDRLVPFSIEGFVGALGDCLGRRIELLPVPIEMGRCGLCVVTKDRDYFCYPDGITLVLQALYAGHEAAHLVFRDAGVQLDNPTELARLAGLDVSLVKRVGLDVSLVKRVLRRTNFKKEAEVRADVFGTLVVQLARHERPARQGPGDSVLGRVQAALTRGEPDG